MYISLHFEHCFNNIVIINSKTQQSTQCDVLMVNGRAHFPTVSERVQRHLYHWLFEVVPSVIKFPTLPMQSSKTVGPTLTLHATAKLGLWLDLNVNWVSNLSTGLQVKLFVSPITNGHLCRVVSTFPIAWQFFHLANHLLQSTTLCHLASSIPIHFNIHASMAIR